MGVQWEEKGTEHTTRGALTLEWRRCDCQSRPSGM